jgi:predicted DsbA family dithiol-disulfide isomerase
MDLQPRSCEAALATIAAERQGFFREYHDRLFATNLQSDDSTLYVIAEEIGLDIVRFESEKQDSISISWLENDIILGSSLQLAATPTVFLNGRHVKIKGTGVLMYFISQELLRKPE